MSKSESASARWTRIITEQRASGLLIAEFCGRQSISQSSFFNWRRRMSAASRAGILTFVEVKVGAPGPGGAAGVDCAWHAASGGAS